MFENKGLDIIDGVGYATIHDVELDPIECTFTGGGAVELDTSEYTSVVFCIEDLLELAKMINEYEDFFNKLED